jgi:ActR/RegA family two-component response regulator
MAQYAGAGHEGDNRNKSRILLVDDDTELLDITAQNLEMRGFEVVIASNVIGALRLISNESFDVLLSDLHVPEVGDGLTVVSAMRHAHPKAVTILVSGYPALQDAMNAIMLQADEVLLKSVGIARIAEIIKRRLSTQESRDMATKVRVAGILDTEAAATIESWMTRVEHNVELISLKLSREERTGHLPRLLADLSVRLRSIHSDRIPISIAAREHGILRRKQGYTIAMIVEESRMLQVSIFNTLQNNLSRVDFDTVLLDVMTIADEVDAQLKQAVLGFTEARSSNNMQALA